jgi:hypothetical protein
MTVKERPVNGRVDRFFTISQRSVVVLCHEAVFEMAFSFATFGILRVAFRHVVSWRTSKGDPLQEQCFYSFTEEGLGEIVALGEIATQLLELR